ncbi:TetR/AcrR family transcriptional regulator [Leucobacter weissii]|uniref:TetR/AcrR family transcriptional regulator n=1 Tax=Leucobacter weissii TaxID=1983706 RepID=A0A939MJ41_9MICO|nr:TetR/AcrR family transcriptional regulator [Leucobacter weissii]MBO1901889.1 TetR/AcrR family transcriptional regulator [Leucobacter weissii]
MADDTTAIDWTPKARQILAAANELFYSRGIHAVGVDAIAERAGVTKKTLYDRFGSKERLVVAYLVGRDQAWRSFLADRLTEAGGDPATRLAAVFAASAAWTAEHSRKGCSMINAHAEISDPSHPAYPVIVGQKQWMLDLFATIAADADAADPAATGRSLMLLHEGALVAAGMGVIPDAYALAGRDAHDLLAGRPPVSA